MNDTLKAEIKNMVARIGDLKVSEIGDDTHLAKDLRMDSLQALELLAELEHHYQIQISEDHLGEFTSINKLTDLVSELTARRATGA